MCERVFTLAPSVHIRSLWLLFWLFSCKSIKFTGIPNIFALSFIWHGICYKDNQCFTISFSYKGAPEKKWTYFIDTVMFIMYICTLTTLTTNRLAHRSLNYFVYYCPLPVLLAAITETIDPLNVFAGLTAVAQFTSHILNSRSASQLQNCWFME